MFLTLLGGTLLLGAGLLTAANYTEGALVAVRTAAQVIGWLLAGAAVVGLLGLRRGSWQKLGAAAVTLSSGATLLFVSYFHWSEIPAVRMPLAVTLASDWATYKFTPVLATEVVGTLAKTQPPPSPPPEADQLPLKRVTATAAVAQPVLDRCAAFGGVEALQCRRCSDASGMRGVVCRESARLEYCENGANDALACPAAISYSPPG